MGEGLGTGLGTVIGTGIGLETCAKIIVEFKQIKTDNKKEILDFINSPKEIRFNFIHFKSKYFTWDLIEN